MRSIGISNKDIAARCADSAHAKAALYAHTKKELEATAAEAGVDISSCKTKDDIIKAIEAVCAE